jgi:hypothetical protein
MLFAQEDAVTVGLSKALQSVCDIRWLSKAADLTKRIVSKPAIAKSPAALIVHGEKPLNGLP